MYSFSLTGGWAFENFVGGIKMTFRTSLPSGDSDADALYQASTDGGQIEGEGEEVAIRIPAEVTNSWPTGVILWDVQGATIDSVYTIDAGTIRIVPDITRSI